MGPSSSKMPYTPIDPIKDSRVTHNYASVNGRKYRGLVSSCSKGLLLTECLDYVQAQKIHPAKATVLMIHGFPDLWCTSSF